MIGGDSLKKESFTIGLLFLLVLSLLTGCGRNKVQQAICSVCNGTGQVKYFYGDKDDEYNWGPCTSCDEKGYIMTVPSGDSNGGKNQICSSCERYVEELITKEDNAGESRSWCADCWDEYNGLIGD